MKKLFWGDIHNHNSIGYGTGSLKRSYEIARGCLLDFYAFTPHGYWPDAPGEDRKISAYHEEGYRKVQEAWADVDAAAERYNTDGEFAVLRGFEWHSSLHGDYCVYLPGTDGATFPAENLDSLKEFAREHDALLIPHHVGYRPGVRGLDWGNFDECFSPVVEGFSEHGCSIEPGTQWPLTGHSMGGLERSQTIFSRLNDGLFFGMTGSTDNHHGHPASFGEGLTGLYMDQLSREDVLDALRNRRSLVATGDRIGVSFNLGNTFMGGIASVGDDKAFGYSVSGFSEMECVQIIKNGFAAHTRMTSGGLDRKGFAARLELGWGGMLSGDVTFWEVEMTVKDGEFIGVSPGFCGGADSEKINRMTRSTGSSIKFEAFTSRKNTRPVSSVAFRCAGESARIHVRCKMHYRGRHFRKSVTASAGELSEKDFWLNPADGFSSPVMKLGEYSPLNMVDAAGRWQDPDMRSGDWYMLKALQKNGHAAWTSPIKLE